MATDDSDRLLQCYMRGLRSSSTAGSARKRRNRDVGIRRSELDGIAKREAEHKSDKCSLETSEGECEIHTSESSGAAHNSDQQFPVDRTPVRARDSVHKPVKTSEISPGVFYGSPLGKPASRPPHVERLLRRICEDLSIQEAQRKAVWSTFARQEQAIEFLDGHASRHELALFVYQDHLTAQRRFLVTTYSELWNRYYKMQANLRHHYEVIREEFPCHLYFDVEFNRVVNQGANGEAMVDMLLEAVELAFQSIYTLRYDPSWTLELDSSTEDKFSRHLILRIPEVAFKSNLHVGAFVAEICKQMQGSERYEQLYVVEGDTRETLQNKLFVDQAVYSRNRSFRLAFSSKAGKTAVLLPTYRFNHQGLQDQSIFMRSLICNIDPDCKTLLTFGEETASGGGRVPFGPALSRPVNHGAFTISGISPFPAIDSFIEAYAQSGDVIGKIRSWYWFSEWGVLVYNISGYRFCENIGRQHKSNNIMYIVDFRTAGFYQKCHDPDCRGYKSPLRPIPREAIPPDFALSRPLELPKVENMELDSCGDDDDDSWWQEVAARFDRI